MESLGIKNNSKTDEAVVIRFMDEHRRPISIENGKIIAGFPFTDEVSNLKDNFSSLLRALQGDKGKYSMYNETFLSYLREGIIEEAKNNSN
ncbi:unnamed protein product [Heligmosomoides polygyrus]|uniref:Uncharacterized protein n=1 Tax=Heligmosomoides polygyrus TaxID=6339 RepID=A0A3P8ED68_HELPZ|nr:unnamed protein product [Heligmosomoides polygyrus]